MLFLKWNRSDLRSYRISQRNNTDINHRNKARCNWRVIKTRDIKFNGCLISRTEIFRWKRRVSTLTHVMICDEIIESNEVVTARSGELSLPLILHPPLRKKKRKKKAKEEEETGHVFGWLSGEIRDRKHLGRGRGSRIICSGALFDGAELRSFARLRGDSGKTSAQSTILTRQDAITPISSLISMRDKDTCRAYSHPLFLSRSRVFLFSLNCLAMEGLCIFSVIIALRIIYIRSRIPWIPGMQTDSLRGRLMY